MTLFCTWTVLTTAEQASVLGLQVAASCISRAEKATYSAVALLIPHRHFEHAFALFWGVIMPLFITRNNSRSLLLFSVAMHGQSGKEKDVFSKMLLLLVIVERSPGCQIYQSWEQASPFAFPVGCALRPLLPSCFYQLYDVTVLALVWPAAGKLQRDFVSFFQTHCTGMSLKAS